MTSASIRANAGIFFVVTASVCLSACASSTPITEEEQTEAIRACFENHKNHPTARMACINRARTADVESEQEDQTE